MTQSAKSLTTSILLLRGNPGRRLGFGSMRLTGHGQWGAPANPEQAMEVLRAAVDHGVTHIDTADAYGPFTAEKYIRKALHPYQDELVVATKGGMIRPGPGRWSPCGRPDYLRQCVEMSLRRLQLERIDLYYLHRMDPTVPLEDQLAVLVDMQAEGKVHHIGLSKVDIAQIQRARGLVDVVAVQNKYNLSNQQHEDVLSYCERHGIAFVPYAPLAAGHLAESDGPLDEMARKYQATPAQLALAWLLHRSPITMPIPGTSTTAHLHENLAAADFELKAADATAIGATLYDATRKGAL
jgi:pyridoxine 4-dehydrogenase